MNKDKSKAKEEYIELSQGCLSYSKKGSIVTAFYFFDKDKNKKKLIYDERKLKHKNSPKNISKAIKLTDLPVYLVSKESILSFASKNSILLCGALKDEVFDILEDFDKLSYRDFINTLSEKEEYSLEAHVWLLDVIKKMKDKNIQAYETNFIILEIIETIKRLG